MDCVKFRMEGFKGIIELCKMYDGIFRGRTEVGERMGLRSSGEKQEQGKGAGVVLPCCWSVDSSHCIDSA